jgi:hypothetical protein
MPATRLFLQKAWPSRFGTSKDAGTGYVRQSATFNVDPTPQRRRQPTQIELQQRQQQHNLAPWSEAADDDLVKSFDVGVSSPQRQGEADDIGLIESGARGWTGASVGVAKSFEPPSSRRDR